MTESSLVSAALEPEGSSAVQLTVTPSPGLLRAMGKAAVSLGPRVQIRGLGRMCEGSRCFQVENRICHNRKLMKVRSRGIHSVMPFQGEQMGPLKRSLGPQGDGKQSSP